MAKKRMGRNLDALLGGASRDRNGRRAGTADRPKPGDAEIDSVYNPAHSDPQDTAATQGQPPTAARVEHDPHNAVVAETPATHQQDTSPSTTGAGTGTDQLVLIDIEKVRRGSYQPRRLFDQTLLQELADSIKSEGMIQPIIVRTFADGYELVAGERRWRAAQMAGIDRVPAIVREMQDQSVAAVSLIENIQRKDLNPLEEAAAFERLCDEFGMTHKAVAESVGRSRASVTNLMRLLELNEEVKLMIDRGELEMGHARALLGAPKDQQFDVALKIVKQGMSVRAVEKYIKSLNTDAGEPAGSADPPVDDPDIERLSQKLSETLGAKVHIQHRSNGGGKLQISYSSVSELQGILAHIK